MKRFHRKTRTGCTQCRTRHVKCDETQPSCRNCRRNYLQCNLLFVTPRRFLYREPNQGAIGNPSSTMSLASPHIDVLLATSTQDLNKAELLHHYTSTVCFTICAEQNTEVWAEEIPRLALSHAFVMHGLLALSAAHLATVQPSRSSHLIRHAAMSEHMALPSFRRCVSSGETADISAVFAFAGFLPQYMLAQSAWLGVPRGRIPGLSDERPHWFFVLRGLVHLLARDWTKILEGPFAPMLRPSNPKSEMNPDDKHYVRLYAMLEQPSPCSVADAKALDVCKVALDELRRVSALPYSPYRTLEATAAVYVWPGSVSAEFLQLISERRPEALVIMAYYCVLLKKANSCWYLKGVGSSMMSAIEQELGDEWKLWISWAVSHPVQGG